MSNVLTKKDLRRCLNRYIFTRQSPFNYETMQSGGWVYSIHPAMEKIYDGDADLLAEKYKDHFKFYNTHPWMGNIILGACIAIESTKDPDATKQAVEMRTALMGPLAGIGDAIIWIMFMTILGAIAAYMALEGSIVGWVIAAHHGSGVCTRPVRCRRAGRFDRQRQIRHYDELWRSRPAGQRSVGFDHSAFRQRGHRRPDLLGVRPQEHDVRQDDRHRAGGRHRSFGDRHSCLSRKIRMNRKHAGLLRASFLKGEPDDSIKRKRCTIYGRIRPEA